MKKKFIAFAILLLIIVLSVSAIAYKEKNSTSNQGSEVNSGVDDENKKTASSVEENQPSESFWVPPVADFKSRITKKPFGMYVTPQNSPVSPERFSGYHTAIDVEYADVTEDVPVYAITDGVIVLSRTASGYGGVFIMEVNIDGKKQSILYGHIRPSSLPSVGALVKKGDKIGILGTGYSSETDGERKHLHFGVLSDNSRVLSGYVNSKDKLSGWVDPLIFLK